MKKEKQKITQRQFLKKTVINGDLETNPTMKK